MQQLIPEFEWSDDALALRRFLYEFWCEHGYGPNLRGVHEALGLDRAAIIAAYKQLQLGKMVVADLTTQNVNILKMLPFSAHATCVAMHLDGRFHSYLGCAMESVAASKMPPFAGKDVVLESYCACCLAPLQLVWRDGALVSSTPADIGIHVSSIPYEWGLPSLGHMCDSMNYVIDATHAARYERMIGRRGVVFTLAQAIPFVAGVADNRMYDDKWPNAPLTPDRIVAGIKALGIDVSNWDPESVSG